MDDKPATAADNTAYRVQQLVAIEVILRTRGREDPAALARDILIALDYIFDREVDRRRAEIMEVVNGR